MSKSLVVVAHELLYAAEISQLSARGLQSSAVGGGLDVRRYVLAQLATELVHSSSPANTNVSGLDGVRAMSVIDAHSSLSTQHAISVPSSIQVLEGLGALIVDDTTVDVERLRRSSVFQVFDNHDVDVPLPKPSLSATATQAHPWHFGAIGSPSASDGHGTLVGVLDTGIAANHREFKNKTVHFQEFDWLGAPVIGHAHDKGDHGTHVCGLIAGETCGVAPSADLAVACVLTRPTPQGMSGSLLQIASGMNWLLGTAFRPGIPGTDVINASLGGVGHNPFLYTTTANAWLAPGTLVIASIGNSGAQSGLHGSPGNYDNVLGVGAYDSRYRMADFSAWERGIVNGGRHSYDKPDLSAPGVDMYSSVPRGYGLMSGTSMAAPVATGVAAALLSQGGSPRGQPAALLTAIRGRAVRQLTLGVNGNWGADGL